MRLRLERGRSPNGSRSRTAGGKLRRGAVAQRTVRTPVVGRTDLQVTFFGGEPLLNYPLIQQVVQYCKSIEQHSDRRFVFELITNGTLLSDEVVDFLVKHQFLLFISIDGWHDMHNYNRPSVSGEDLHETIVRNALRANEKYQKHKLPAIKVRANLTDKYNDGVKVAEYLESLGFTLIGIGAIAPMPHGDGCPSAMSEDQMDELTEQSDQRMFDALGKIQRGEPIGPYLAKMFRESLEPVNCYAWLGAVCGVCRNTTVIDTRGDMFPCHRYSGMAAYRFGNVFTGPDRQFVAKYYRDLNARAIEHCNDCWIRDCCAGGCPWLVSDKEGIIHGLGERECARRRRGFERRLWLRKEIRACFPERFKNSEEVPLEEWNWNINP